MNNPSLMRLFCEIADRGTLSSVARAWGVAPSTITLGLKKLEERLGVKLVLRTTRKLSLTPEGEKFLSDCRRILTDLDEVMNGFSQKGPLSGEIRLTVMNDLGRVHIGPLMHSFMEQHPEVRIHLYLSDTVLDLVGNGFDIGIRTGPLQDSNLKARLLCRGHKVICASPSYWKKHGKPKHPDDLAEHNCMVLAMPGMAQTSWNFSQEGKKFKVRISGDRTVNDGQALKDWAIYGGGVIMKSFFDVANELETGKLETALQDFTMEATNLYAVFPPQFSESRRIRAFLDHISKALSHLTSD